MVNITRKIISSTVKFTYLPVVFFNLYFPKKVLAQETVETGLGTIPTDPGELVSDIVEFATKLAGAAALLLLIFGGIKLIASQGDYEAIEDARKTITAAITGLLVVIFAVLLLRLIGYDILNLPGWEPGGIIDIS